MGPADDINQLEHRQIPLAALHGVSVDPAQLEAAMTAAAEEKAMTFKAVMRIYWRAALWSCTFSLALVMEGYDLGIVRLLLLYRLFHTHGRANFELYPPRETIPP